MQHMLRLDNSPGESLRPNRGQRQMLQRNVGLKFELKWTGVEKLKNRGFSNIRFISSEISRIIRSYPMSPWNKNKALDLAQPKPLKAPKQTMSSYHRHIRR